MSSGRHESPTICQALDFLGAFKSCNSLSSHNVPTRRAIYSSTPQPRKMSLARIKKQTRRYSVVETRVEPRSVLLQSRALLPGLALLGTAILQIPSSRQRTDLPPATNERRYACLFKMRGHGTKASKGSSKVRSDISGEGILPGQRTAAWGHPREGRQADLGQGPLHRCHHCTHTHAWTHGRQDQEIFKQRDKHS